jgi:hypothetical protein
MRRRFSNGPVFAIAGCIEGCIGNISLVRRHVSMLLPQLAELDLMENGEPNSHLRFLRHIGRHFQAVTKDGEKFASQIFLNILDNTGHCRVSLIVRPAGKSFP